MRRNLCGQNIELRRFGKLPKDRPRQVGVNVVAERCEMVLRNARIGPFGPIVANVGAKPKPQHRLDPFKPRSRVGVHLAMRIQVAKISFRRRQDPDTPEIAEHMRLRRLALENPESDLLLRGRGLVPVARVGGELELYGGRAEIFSQSLLDLRPLRPIAIFCLTRAQQIDWRHGVFVAPIPELRAGAGLFAHGGQQGFEFGGRNAQRQRAPAISIAQKDDEVRSRRDAFRPGDFGQADLDGSLVEAGFLAHPPAQVDRLKSRAVGEAELPQTRKSPLLQGVSLGAKVVEGRADKDSERATALRHRRSLFRVRGIANGAGSPPTPCRDQRPP